MDLWEQRQQHEAERRKKEQSVWDSSGNETEGSALKHMFFVVKEEFESTQMVDFTQPGFERITNAGLAELVEIPNLCADLVAIFSSPS